MRFSSKNGNLLKIHTLALCIFRQCFWVLVIVNKRCCLWPLKSENNLILSNLEKSMRTLMKHSSRLKSLSGWKSYEKEFIWLCSCLFSLSYFKVEFIVDLHQSKSMLAKRKFPPLPSPATYFYWKGQCFQWDMIWVV